jgi:hypothetical protein
MSADARPSSASASRYCRYSAKRVCCRAHDDSATSTRSCSCGGVRGVWLRVCTLTRQKTGSNWCRVWRARSAVRARQAGAGACGTWQRCVAARRNIFLCAALTRLVSGCSLPPSDSHTPSSLGAMKLLPSWLSPSSASHVAVPLPLWSLSLPRLCRAGGLCCCCCWTSVTSESSSSGGACAPPLSPSSLLLTYLLMLAAVLRNAPAAVTTPHAWHGGCAC